MQLSENQKKGIETIHGPVLLIAGAGAGKTLVLIKRISYMLRLGIKAENIIVLTFTNKSAKEMINRIKEEVTEEDLNGLWIGTFHSLFARILRQEHETIGFRREFTINDTSDSISLIKQITKDLELSLDSYKPKEVARKISTLKNNLITWSQYKGNQENLDNDYKSNIPEFHKIYEKYCVKCHFSSIMDFDDLLLQTNILFRNDKILQKYQEQFHYIMVDEYQDTNISQFRIIKKLADVHNNICVVGDDAQSIYSFRGAKIENILNFRNVYRHAKSIFLDENYRSTQVIVEASNSIIKNNTRQIPKKIFSSREIGEKIKLFRTYNEREEAKKVISQIKRLVDFYGYNYADCCILYRNNNLSFFFEEKLINEKIPYKIYGGFSFYQRKEIKDFFYYLKLCINPTDDIAFTHVLQYPSKGIGKATIEKIASQNNTSLWKAAEQATLKPKALEQIKTLKTLFKNFNKKSENLDAFQLSKEILEASKIMEDLAAEPEKTKNINDLLESIKSFVESANESDNKLQNFIAQASLLTSDEISTDELTNDKVALMTIHAAKGLEFKNIFIVGMEQGIFPSQYNETISNIEEERRLFYVAITRAKKNLYMSYAQNRATYGYGKPEATTPSIFLQEIESSYFEN